MISDFDKQLTIHKQMAKPFKSLFLNVPGAQEHVQHTYNL